MLAAIRRCAAALAMLFAVPALAAVPLAAALPRSSTHLNEDIIRVPAGPSLAVTLETTVYKPDGPGPFPLLVINHGKAAGDPKLQSRDRFVFMASAFVRRGYAVMVPMRTGFAQSTGNYIEHGCNMTANGYTQANDVRDVIRYARRQNWVDAQRIVVAGQSYGGLATMALATQAVPGVRGVMNFAGGLKMMGGNCDWQQALVRAFGEYGRRGKVASLWMYGANDQYFPPALADRLHQAYTGAGGRAELVAFGPFKRDAHTMLASRDGEAVWLPEAARFLARIGMPFEERYALADPGVQAPSHYAALDDVSALPYLAANGRAAYQDFLQLQTPRAFAVSPTGAWGWAEEGEDPRRSALAACQSKSAQPCQLYTVDEAVVWQGAGRTD
ncbi:MAG: prolyl oligopeptidase family serine peptidase [Burkholderiaceae bacterium]|nr:prolyl oligopeptidase family serine peptidase [Burkholderiaceae bacterium]